MKKKIKKPAAVPYEPLESHALRDPKVAAEFLNNVYLQCKKENLEMFFEAILKVVKAFGVTDVATQVDVTRAALYKAFGDHKNPTSQTLLNTLDALNLEIKVVEKRIG